MTTPGDPIPFTWADAWLLLTISHAGGSRKGATLEDVILWGDAINRAVFSNDELRRGLARLIAGGYVEPKGQRWRICGEAARFFKREKVDPFSTIGQRKVEQFLKAPSWAPGPGPKDEDPRWNRESPTDDEIKTANEAVLRRTEKYEKKLNWFDRWIGRWF